MKNFEYAYMTDLLRNSRSIVVTSHHNPDGDAVGSVLALARVLQDSGKSVTPIVPNEYPGFLKWIPGQEQVLVYENEPVVSDEVIISADIIFCLDYNALDRTGSMQKMLSASRAVKILIDHHLEPKLSDFTYYLSEIEISSTSELVYQFIRSCGLSGYIGEAAATGLYVGIMTDTGSFAYSCDFPDTFNVVADLVSKGISPGYIHRLVYDTYSESRLRLLGYCLSDKLTVLPDLYTAYIALSKAELKRFDHQVGDTEGVVNYALSIEGIKLAVLMTERDDRIRISFRSKGSFSVNLLAREHFLGGGHRNAAGGDSFATLDETILKLKQVLLQYKDELDRS